MPRKQNLKIKVGLNLQRSSNNRIFFFHMPCIVGVLSIVWSCLNLDQMDEAVFGKVDKHSCCWSCANFGQDSLECSCGQRTPQFFSDIGDNNCLDYDLPVVKPVASEGSAGDQKLCCRGCRRCDSRSWRDYKCVGGGLFPSTTPIEQ
ncbi:unnamed protein product [Brassica oleracea]